jgi:hypothetical protein
VKDLSIPLRLCVFARIKKNKAPRNSAGQAAKQPRPACLPAAGRRSKVYFNPISLVFLFISRSLPTAGRRSGVFFYFISIVFPAFYLQS